MRFSDIGIALMTLIVSVYSQDTEQPVTNLNDVRPGHIEDMAALPYEIVSVLFLATFNFTIANISPQQRCIRFHVPMAWHFYPEHLDLFCDKSTGQWHQDLPICIADAFPSSSAHAISLYNNFSAALCRGYAGPGMPLTTLLTVDERLTTSTIFPPPSETRYVIPTNTGRHPSSSNPCFFGHDNCGQSTPIVYASKSSKWRQTTLPQMPTTTEWGVGRRPTTVAMPTK